MKRRLIAMIVGAALVMGALAGCTSNTTPADVTTTQENAEEEEETQASEDEEEDTTGEPSGDAVELVVWESLSGPDEWIKQAGEAFTAENPNISIKFVNMEIGEAASQIELDGPGGVGPDLFGAPHDHLGRLASGGHILEVANPGDVTGMVLESAATALTYDGTLYGYPTSSETYALYYNKDLIPEEDVPTTWADLVAWAEEFNTVNPDKNAFVMDVGSIYYSILFTTRGGNRLFGPEGNDMTNSYLNTEDAIAGMKEFQSLKSILNVPAADLSIDFVDGAFAAGTAAMHISGPWNVANFTDAGLDFGVTTLPSLEGDSTPAASFSGTRGMFVSAYSDHPEEAALFAEFLISEEMQNLRYEITGALPAIDMEVTSPYDAGFIAQLEYAFPMPSIPQMAAVWDSGDATVAAIWDGADVESELTTLNDTIAAYVAE